MASLKATKKEECGSFQYTPGNEESPDQLLLDVSYVLYLPVESLLGLDVRQPYVGHAFISGGTSALGTCMRAKGFRLPVDRHRLCGVHFKLEPLAAAKTAAAVSLLRVRLLP
jgi:hypothetical protein